LLNLIVRFLSGEPGFLGGKGNVKVRIIISLFIWLTAFGMSARAAEVIPYGALDLPPFISPIDHKDSTFNLSVEDFRLMPFRESFSLAPDGIDAELQGLKARYQMDLSGTNLELSGGYVPGTKAVIPSDPQFDRDTYLGYVSVKIPFHRFFVNGGAFFGQNMDALALIGQRPFDERGLQTSIFGYQIGGGYKLSDSLSIQAGWGQATQERDVARDDLKAWYLKAQISLGWRISISPQVGYVDFTNGDGEKTKEEAFYCGARWQINF
jgi:hypothetical protein